MGLTGRLLSKRFFLPAPELPHFRSFRFPPVAGKGPSVEKGLEKKEHKKEKTFLQSKRPASPMVMVDRGEIFSKGKMATK